MKISYDDFKKAEIRAGKILSAEKIPDTDKLLALTVDLGDMKETPHEAGRMTKLEPAPRSIVSGIAAHFPDPSVLVGRTCMFVANLEPRTIRGRVSDGMIFALSTGSGEFSLLEPDDAIPPGTLAG
ncbi:MAG: hypothetical protein KGI69_04040 [Patescibacteria group bacterium]|nr:hypothetical protein [Patescibacteria group bacterium]